jgi:hypothetical protein
VVGKAVGTMHHARTKVFNFSKTNDMFEVGGGAPKAQIALLSPCLFST